jgi:sugar phosphate isomerase/epimerase
MRISFSTAALYPRLSLEALKLLNNAGFKEAELMPQCYHETTPEFAKEVKKLEIRVSSIHFPLSYFSVLYNPYEGMVKEAKNLVDDLLLAGEIMGTDVIVIHALPYMEEVKKEIFYDVITENIKYLASKGKEKNIKIALENNPNTLGRTPEGLLDEVKRIDHDNVQPMVDTTESWEADIEPEIFISKTRPVHLHLSDYKGDVKHLPLGEGKGNWEMIFNTIKSIDYSGIYVIEPAYKFYIDDVVNKVRNAKNFIENI